MISKSKITRLGEKGALEFAKQFVESRGDQKNDFLESVGFKEDNTMSNSDDMYTTVLAKSIWYKSYDRFKQYYDAVIEYKPEDFGGMEGSGVYKIPKIEGASAVKISSGEAIPYINNYKDSVVIETEAYGIGTRINRRIRKKAARGFIDKLMTAGSDAVQRYVASDIANGMVAGASSDNTVTGGISYDKIEDAKKNIKSQTSSSGELFGFYPDTLALSTEGMHTLTQDDSFKNVFYRQNVPGSKTLDAYTLWQGLRVMEFDLITAQKDGSDVHAVVSDSNHFFAFLKEGNMETYDGRLPGTAGDEEIILSIDAGMVAMNAEAGAVITA